MKYKAVIAFSIAILLTVGGIVVLRPVLEEGRSTSISYFLWKHGNGPFETRFLKWILFDPVEKAPFFGKPLAHLEKRTGLHFLNAVEVPEESWKGTWVHDLRTMHGKNAQIHWVTDTPNAQVEQYAVTVDGLIVDFGLAKG
jgi:hypothetical protein